MDIHIDGGIGEGGGQTVRTALSLAAITGRPLRLTRIRAGRQKPGLMRQHLTCAKAIASVTNGQLEGDEIGSSELYFRPQQLQCGHFEFAIGSAGSTMLVLQTLLPVLLFGTGPSTLRIQGGTHVPMAPTADYILHVFLPMLRRMGAKIALEIERCGFMPAGGGDARCVIQPGRLQPIDVIERGAPVGVSAHALCVGLPTHIGSRELQVMAKKLSLKADQCHLHQPADSTCVGNAMHCFARFANVTEGFSCLGERKVPAETLAEDLAGVMQTYLRQSAPVSEHLADQLLLPLALAGGGQFVCTQLSDHLRTNALVIEAFEIARIQFAPYRDGHLVRLSQGQK